MMTLARRHFYDPLGQSVLVHIFGLSFACSTRLSWKKMPRGFSGPQHHSYLVGASHVLPEQQASKPITTYGNAPVTARHPALPRKPPKATSFSIPRVSSAPVDAESILAQRMPEPSPTTPVDRGVKRQTSYTAAEKGKGDLLPLTARPPQEPSRVRSMSSNSMSTWNAKAPQREDSVVTRTLRSRGKRTSSSSVDSTSLDAASMHQVRPYNSAPSGWSFSSDRPHATAYGQQKSSTNLFQLFAALVVTCLVYESYRRALSTTEQFAKLRHDESMVLLHLRKVEQSSIHLHEQLTRLNDGTVLEFKETDAGSQDGSPVDAELIRVQTQQLVQMEEELQHELRGLQTKLQHSARTAITEAYGEGPVQVSFDLDFGDVMEAERIVISLWYDTPYAAWLLLDQVRRGQWKGARFSLDKGMSISATPDKLETDRMIDFIEQGHEKHEAWTVGLADVEGGGFSLFINLQDNTGPNKRKVCVGKVIEGFGTLQKLIASTRKFDGTDRAITIKHATGSRMPTSNSAGIFD